VPLRGREWPFWWDWELDFTSHLLKRMTDRDFTEVDLRRMLELGSRLREDCVEGRWIVETWRLGQPWEVIVEPDHETERLVVITAYPLW
jgi:hypothetical protein